MIKYIDYLVIMFATLLMVLSFYFGKHDIIMNLIWVAFIFSNLLGIFSKYKSESYSMKKTIIFFSVVIFIGILYFVN